MGQKIDIEVQAGTASAEAGIKRLETAADKAAAAVSKIGSGAEAIAASIQKAAARSAEQINSAKSILEREKGKPLSDSDTAKFLDNWDRMRKSRAIGSNRVRAFDSFEDWDQGVGGTFRKPSDARAHRMRMIQVGLQGTGFARSNPSTPDEEEPDEPPERQPAWRRAAGAAAARAPGMASGMVGSMLALAGIGAVGSMAGQANQNFTEEAIGTDTLRRRAGTLGVSFDKLREQVRAATGGLGITYTESMRLAQGYAKEYGAIRAAAVNGGGLQSVLHTGMALARAYGIDPGAGTSFVATMQRLRVTSGNDQDNRKLANLIAEAVKKGGYPGKVDELLSATADFASNAARWSLTTPNVSGYLSEMAGLINPNQAGRDPAGMANMLGRADASIRNGGAFGEAGLNFTMRAFQRGLGGTISPFATEALYQGGLFATPRSLFGKGGQFEGWVGQDQLRAGGDRTVFSMVKDQLWKESGGSAGRHTPYQEQLAVDAAHNLMGLNLANAKLLLETPEASLSKKDKQNILDQYKDFKDPGSSIRDSMTSIDNELTRTGGGVAHILMSVRDSVEALAQRLAPEEYKEKLRAEREEKTDFVKKYKKGKNGLSEDLNLKIGAFLGLNPDVPNLNDAIKTGSQLFDASLKSGRPKSLDSIFPHIADSLFTAEGSVPYVYTNAVRQGIQKHMRDMGYDAHGIVVPGATKAAISGGAGGAGGSGSWLDDMLGLIRKGEGSAAAAAAYNRRHPGANLSPDNVVSPTGAVGIYQIEPSLAQSLGFDPSKLHNAAYNKKVAAAYLQYLHKKFGDDNKAIAAAYNGGEHRARKFQGHGHDLADLAPETRGYLGRIFGDQREVKVSHQPLVVQFVDKNNVPLNQVSLASFKPGGASGSSQLPAFAMGVD